jgi:asparagine synthase (glutamine-hydrolysing)
MPGLIGIVWNNRTEETLVDKMSNSIKHEDWHRVDKYSDYFCSVARVSLGIFNPEPQPIFNEAKTLCIFMYGKIYDYDKQVEELRKRGHPFTVGNDAEFCLHSYEEYGQDFVKELNGSFVLVIYDLKRKRIVIANDRYGFRPLYYAVSGGKFLFASEVKAILEDNSFKRELDDRTIADFFAFGEILGNKTFFNGIETIPPASILVYEAKDLRIQQYWDIHYKPDYSLSEDEIIDNLIHTSKSAMDIRMRDDLRYGIALSGGMDSRAVLASIDREQRNRVTAFTFGMPGCQEIEVAQRVAERAGVHHLVKDLDVDDLVNCTDRTVYLSDGMDTIAVSFLPYVYDAAREHVDVFYGGIALEVLLGGIYQNRSIFESRSNEELSAILYRQMSLFPPQMMAALFIPEYYAKIKGMPQVSLTESLYGINEEHPGCKCDHFGIQNHGRRLVILGSVIARNKVEESLPTFDNDFIEVALKIPPEMRANYRLYRRYMKRCAPELAAIPYQRTMVRVDAPLIAWSLGMKYQGIRNGRIRRDIWRLTGGRVYLPNKRLFVNFDELFRVNETWQSLVTGLLLDENSCSRRYFKKDCIEMLLGEHVAWKANRSRQLNYLATFELFLRMFVDGM